jgi:serine protease Do
METRNSAILSVLEVHLHRELDLTRFTARLLLTATLGCTGAASQAIRQQPPPVVAPTRHQVIQSVLSHTVRLQIYDGNEAQKTGSGVVIASDAGASYVVTNAHVVFSEGYKHRRVRVLVDQGRTTKTYDGEVLAEGQVPDLDLALVKIPGVTLSPAPLAQENEVDLGDTVVVAGAPYGKGLSLSGGMVSAVEYGEQDHLPNRLKTDAPIGYGASGGGIYSLVTGKLLAIVEGYRTAKVDFAVLQQDYSFDVPMPGETFASPVPKLRRFLEAKGFGALVPSVTTEARAPTTQRDVSGS